GVLPDLPKSRRVCHPRNSPCSHCFPSGCPFLIGVTFVGFAAETVAKNVPWQGSGRGPESLPCRFPQSGAAEHGTENSSNLPGDLRPDPAQVCRGVCCRPSCNRPRL